MGKMTKRSSDGSSIGSFRSGGDPERSRGGSSDADAEADAEAAFAFCPDIPVSPGLEVESLRLREFFFDADAGREEGLDLG